MDEIVRVAIDEAIKGRGWVAPNPEVGCVIFAADGKILAKGYHKKYGGPHAEIEALLALGIANPHQPGEQAELLRDCTVFVTLEPCAHEGKTPSCAKALRHYPIKKLIYGLVDPNPLVAGQGAKILQVAGVEVEEYQGPLKTQLEEVCEQFLCNFREKRPFISIKVASSLDGQMALKSGESKWITGEAARLHAHYLRATHQAILVGQGTLEADNPALNIRHPDFPNKKNKVIVLLGQSLENLKPKSWNIWRHHNAEDIFFLQRQVNSDYLSLSWSEARGWQPTLVEGEIQVYQPNFVPRSKSLVQFHSILIEGGARVISSIIDRNLADRLYLFQAPIILGSKFGRSWSEEVRILEMSRRLRIDGMRAQMFGEDILLSGRFPRLIK